MASSQKTGIQATTKHMTGTQGWKVLQLYSLLKVNWYNVLIDKSKEEKWTWV
jgi:hypothetical protein